jgi:hypothetical protein
MMHYALKGFITNSLFKDNVPGQTKPFGEITTQALTYAKEKGEYFLDTSPTLGFFSFLSKLGENSQQVPKAVSDHVLTIAAFVYDKTLNTGGAIGRDELLQDLISHFGTVASTFTSGPMVTDGRYYVPEWLAWKSTDIQEIADNEIRIWFSDAAFREQYDEFKIVVVPPTDRVDDFFNTPSDVIAMLNDMTINRMTTLLQTAKGNYPETIVRVESYNYVNPLDETSKTPSPWGLVIYGIAGNNIDAIADALIKYILENSTHTREEWMKILPDLFRRTEFIILPRWNNVAIEQRPLSGQGTYSPIVNLNEAPDELKRVVASYPVSHINTFADMMGHPFKSIALLTIGGPDNRDDTFRLIDLFPDLIAVASTSIDFNRMTQLTQGFLLMLGEMLIMAETVSEFTTMPIGTTRTKRDDILYIVRNYANVNYLVATKSSIYVPPQVPQ